MLVQDQAFMPHQLLDSLPRLMLVALVGFRFSEIEVKKEFEVMKYNCWAKNKKNFLQR